MHQNITEKKRRKNKTAKKGHKKQNLTFTHTHETNELTKLEATYKGLIG